MSGSYRQGNRFTSGKSDGRRNNTHVGPGSVWKPKAKTATDGSSGSASSCQNTESPLSSECTSTNSSNTTPKPDSNIHVQEQSLLPLVKDVASGMNNLKLIPNPSEMTYNCSEQPKSEKEKQVGDNSGISEDANRTSSTTRFDICPKKHNNVVKLKAPLHVRNREKRNQEKRSAQGPIINMLRPGMILLKSYITSEEQIAIVKTCRDLGIGVGGFYQPGYRDGGKLHLNMMCLGKNWDPQSSKYGETRPIDNAKPPAIPNKFHDMVKKAIQDSNAHIQKNSPKPDAGKLIPSILSDICIVNFYTKGGKLGLHQDKDESPDSLSRGLPVVSFSIGDSAEFLYGDDSNIDKAEKVTLESGDVLIFGGKSRRIFHGVTKINPDTAPSTLLEATDMRPGRLNLTFRQY